MSADKERGFGTTDQASKAKMLESLESCSFYFVHFSPRKVGLHLLPLGKVHELS